MTLTFLPGASEPADALEAYEEACRSLGAALAKASAVDEVVDVRSAADLLRLRARQAQNKRLEIDAAELRIRAERKIGEMIAEQREGVGLARPGQGADGRFAPSELPSLDDVGVDKNLAKRARLTASLPPGTFEDLLGRRREDIEAGRRRVTVNLFDAAPTSFKAERRAAREVELAQRQRALPERCYGVILADPEWRFEPRSRESGMDRAADNHYPTSTTDAIAARDVRSIAADDCVLFLWATIPMLPDALEVMAAWGFTYRSHIVWMKERVGTGYWFRGAHELLLVGTRGRPPAPAPGTQWPSVFLAPVGAHSAKPERALEMIEAYYPTLLKIELNRRGPMRRDWDAWGNEAEEIVS